MEMLTFVIDIDDTILEWNDNRDYVNFKPIQKTIDQINKLYDQGHKIILFTARGSKSLNGDIERIQTEYVPPLKESLKINNVKYSELLIGKPYGDYYVDNKNISIEEFQNAIFRTS